MEPVEINAGGYYLRPLRADTSGPQTIDDRQRVCEAFADEQLRRYVTAFQVPDLAAADEYIQQRALEWHADARCSWAVAEPTTGELLAEVGLKDITPRQHSAEVACWTHPAHRGRGVLAGALPAVLRFGYGALQLHHIGYRHAASNTASGALARRCGFTLDGTLRAAAWIDGKPEDVLCWSRLATDPAG